MKKIKLLGREFNVGSDEECDQCDWWICARIDPDQPAPFPEAHRDLCTNCHHPVWFDSRMKVDRPKKLCLECAMSILPKKRNN